MKMIVKFDPINNTFRIDFTVALDIDLAIRADLLIFIKKQKIHLSSDWLPAHPTGFA